MKTKIKAAVLFSFCLLLAVFAVYRGGLISAQSGAPLSPIEQQAQQFPTNINLDCAGCHGAGKALPYMAGEKFHKDAHNLLADSIHAKTDANGKPAASCLECHARNGDTTTILPAENPDSTVNRANLTQTCGSCHGEAVQTFHTSIHGKLRDQGEDKAASCADCHGGHSVLSKDDPRSTVYRKQAQLLCSQCHNEVVADYESSSHGHALREGHENAPSCTDCHQGVSHATGQEANRDFNLQMIDNCSKCHKEEAPSYRDTFHGQATALGYKPAATCADCHTPHRNLAATDPRSSISAQMRPQTCAKCHAGTDTNPSFATYNPHPEPTNPEKGFMTYIVYTFMSTLLLGVFAFFGLHTILWLQRSLVEYFTTKHGHNDPDDEIYVVRFAKTHRFTHLLIIISFLGLAATGLPLMYYYTDWGQWLVRAHGGLGVTRVLHRVCAVITLGYALIHLFYIVKKVILERNFSILWGPDSMMIRPKDIGDVIGMFRWFFYLGPKPKLDRWTYWEKFDYFAVFWGIPVIGISGLMLWFPSFFASFLPGEALNIAHIVHSEEALLATAFIFSFHFFHNHLRPENFPMDLVMFTGKMRLSRFKEERPEEYERLVEAGELDSIIVPPPSDRFKFFAKIFGFWAYLFGLFLVIAIIVTLFAGRH